jgi:hypothetical protein
MEAFFIPLGGLQAHEHFGPNEQLSVWSEKLWWASPIVFGPRTLVRTWGSHVEQ